MSETAASYGSTPPIVLTPEVPLVLSIADIARICHEANRALCLALGDPSQVGWTWAPDWQKDSAVAGVRYVLLNPTAGPGAQHVQWMNFKLAQGWTYGLVKDAEKKEHPCIKPWNELPEAQRTKDVLFGSIARSLGSFVVWPE